MLTGTLLFVAGMVVNIHSDHILRNLRKPGETGYKIPQGKKLRALVFSERNPVVQPQPRVDSHQFVF